jgi:predicted ATP-dependent endonuclease of OLD family
MESLVIVEGASDRVALETLAERRGRDLAAEGVEVVAIGGAQAIAAFLRRVGREVRIAGLCDAGEEADFRRGLERAGFGSVADRGAL